MNKELRDRIAAGGVRLEQITITSEPLNTGKRSPEEIALMRRLYDLAHKDPQKAVSQLLAAIEKYTHIQELYQTLGAVYHVLGEYKKTIECAKKTYALFPDYLFAKCSYAHWKMNEGLVDQVPAIFNNTFSLKSLYPERSVFHVSEVVVHATCMANYFCEKKQFEQAQIYVEMIDPFDPDGDITLPIELKIFAGLVPEMEGLFGDMQRLFDGPRKTKNKKHTR